MEVRIIDGNLERAIKLWQRKVGLNMLARELRDRQGFMSKGQKRRLKIRRAAIARRKIQMAAEKSEKYERRY